jgi:hypothetical protein
LANPKIQHFDRPIGSQLDIRRLQIAVDDSQVVRDLKRFGDLRRDRQRFFDRNRALRDAIGERRTIDELEDQRVRVT